MTVCIISKLKFIEYQLINNLYSMLMSDVAVDKNVNAPSLTESGER